MLMKHLCPCPKPTSALAQEQNTQMWRVLLRSQPTANEYSLQMFKRIQNCLLLSKDYNVGVRKKQPVTELELQLECDISVTKCARLPSHQVIFTCIWRPLLLCNNVLIVSTWSESRSFHHVWAVRDMCAVHWTMRWVRGWLMNLWGRWWWWSSKSICLSFLNIANYWVWKQREHFSYMQAHVNRFQFNLH